MWLEFHGELKCLGSRSDWTCYVSWNILADFELMLSALFAVGLKCE